MTDFEDMVGTGALKARLSRHIDSVVDIEREIDNLKDTRKENLSAAESEDRLNGRAIAALAKFQRTGKMTAPVEVWPVVEAYADILGMILPGAKADAGRE
jgi:hypothetical protein